MTYFCSCESIRSAVVGSVGTPRTLNGGLVLDASRLATGRCGMPESSRAVPVKTMCEAQAKSWVMRGDAVQRLFAALEIRCGEIPAKDRRTAAVAARPQGCPTGDAPPPVSR